MSLSNHMLTQGFSAVARVPKAASAISTKVGIVPVVLGGMHFINMFNFAKIRSKSKKGKGLYVLYGPVTIPCFQITSGATSPNPYPGEA